MISLEVGMGLSGHNRWRKQRATTLYDYRLIGEIENTLKRYILQSDVDALMSFLACHTDRNIGGIMNPSLYEKSLIGTKELIHYFQGRVPLFLILDHRLFL
jgi:Domain of unknown function (DUF3336)